MKLKPISFSLESNQDSPETFHRLEPVSVTDLQTQARLPTMMIPPAEDISYLRTLIGAAREQVESVECRIQLLDATFDGFLDAFPPLCSNLYGDYRLIELPKPPLLEVVSVNYKDEDGTEQVLDPSLYSVETNWTEGVMPAQLPALGHILLGYDEEWPTTRLEKDAVRIRFRAGFGDTPAEVPNAIRQFIQILAATMYEHREREAEGRMGELQYVSGLLDPWRAPRVIA